MAPVRLSRNHWQTPQTTTSPGVVYGNQSASEPLSMDPMTITESALCSLMGYSGDYARDEQSMKPVTITGNTLRPALEYSGGFNMPWDFSESPGSSLLGPEMMTTAMTSSYEPTAQADDTLGTSQPYFDEGADVEMWQTCMPNMSNVQVMMYPDVPRAPGSWLPGSLPSEQTFGATCSTRLLESIELGGEECAQALHAMRGLVLFLSLDQAGCRVVQRALEVANELEAAELVAELHGQVFYLVTSPHGNFVVQKIITTQPQYVSSFISDELAGNGSSTARHLYGCRVLSRLIEAIAREQSSNSLIDQTVGESHLPLPPGLYEDCTKEHHACPLIDEVLEEAEQLCRHSSAHYVMMSVIETGLPDQKKRVIDAICREPAKIARSRHGSYVVARALVQAAPPDRQAIAEAILCAGGDALQALLKSHKGGEVARSLARIDTERFAQVVSNSSGDWEQMFEMLEGGSRQRARAVNALHIATRAEEKALPPGRNGRWRGLPIM